jgi:predicted porin
MTELYIRYIELKLHYKFIWGNNMSNKIIKTLGAAVILSSVAGTAAADIVIGETETTKLMMYGILDVGILYQSNPSVEGEEKFAMETSGLRQTVFGFKGTRELDGSTSAFFNLEAHFDLDTGMFHGSGDAAGEADDSSGNLLFRRQANIGLTGDWGTVIAGRQYGPALLAHLGTEPRIFKEQFSNLYSWAYTQLFSTVNDSASQAGRNTNNDVGIFFKNAIQYRNNINGLDFGVLYSFGGQEGSSKNGDVIAVGASYGAGPVTLSGSYQVMSDQDTGKDVVESMGFGAAYNIGAVDLKVNFLNTENNDSLGNELLDVDALGFGVDYKWSDKNSMTVAYYINEDKASVTKAETKSLVISNEFMMGDSTTLYTALAYVDADDMGTISQYATSIVAAPAPVGEKTTLVNVGINFAF